MSASLEKEAVFKWPILALFSTNQNKALILSTYDSNSVLSFDEERSVYEMSFEFESGVIVGVMGKYMVMENKIYEMDLVNNSIKELWVGKSPIVSADFDGKFIGFQCLDSSYRFFNTETREIDRVRKNCAEEYIWKFQCPERLLVGGLDLPGKLKVVPVFREAAILSTGCSSMISDLTPWEDRLLIAFADCKVNVYEFASMRLLETVDCASEPLRLLPYGSKMLAYANN
jgi:hypothetical protein